MDESQSNFIFVLHLLILAKLQYYTPSNCHERLSNIYLSLSRTKKKACNDMRLFKCTRFLDSYVCNLSIMYLELLAKVFVVNL